MTFWDLFERYPHIAIGLLSWATLCWFLGLGRLARVSGRFIHTIRVIEDTEDDLDG